jgi:hypothetical protein
MQMVGGKLSVTISINNSGTPPFGRGAFLISNEIKIKNFNFIRYLE